MLFHEGASIERQAAFRSTAAAAVDVLGKRRGREPHTRLDAGIFAGVLGIQPSFSNIWRGHWFHLSMLHGHRYHASSSAQDTISGAFLVRNPRWTPIHSAMAQLQTVLFDLDGTLIDSVRLILDSYHYTLQTHGLPPRTDDEWLEGIGTPLTAQFSAWRDTAGMLEALIATYREYNLKHHDRMVTVYPGVVDVVRRSRTTGSPPDWSPARTGRGRSED